MRQIKDELSLFALMFVVAIYLPALRMVKNKDAPSATGASSGQLQLLGQDSNLEPSG
jgi:hypothetical protein